MRPDYKVVFKNIFHLGLLQGANYILPLLTIPYLVRVLSPEGFGRVSFALSAIGFFYIVADFGFNLTATKDISVSRADARKISEIVSRVVFSKILLCLACGGLLFLVVENFDRFSSNKPLYYSTYLHLIGLAFIPVWFFQGYEQMRYVSLLTVFARSVYVFSIFIFVKSIDDDYLVPLFSGFSYIVASAVAYGIMLRQFNVVIKYPALGSIFSCMRSSKDIFISNLVTSTYATATPFVLGLVADNVTVGLYSAAERLIKAVQSLMLPVFQSIYPFLSRISSSDPLGALRSIRWLLLLVILVCGTMSAVVFVFADKIILIALGDQYVDALPILKILSVLPLFGALNNALGIQTLLVFDRKSVHLFIISMASIIYIVSSLILVSRYEAIGSAISLMAAEIFIPLAIFVYLQGSDLKLIGRKR